MLYADRQLLLAVEQLNRHVELPHLATRFFSGQALCLVGLHARQAALDQAQQAIHQLIGGLWSRIGVLWLAFCGGWLCAARARGEQAQQLQQLQFLVLRNDFAGGQIGFVEQAGMLQALFDGLCADLLHRRG